MSRPSLRVLSVDDHPINRVVVETILELMSADVCSVEDGAQAVEAFQAGGFDIVLMDLQMPVMNGMSAIREIRRLEAASASRRNRCWSSPPTPCRRTSLTPWPPERTVISPSG